MFKVTNRGQMSVLRGLRRQLLHTVTFFFFFFLLFCFKIVSITTKHAEDTVTLLLDHTSYLLRQAYKYLSSGYGVDRKICHEGQGSRGLPSDADQ